MPDSSNLVRRLRIQSIGKRSDETVRFNRSALMPSWTDCEKKSFPVGTFRWIQSKRSSRIKSIFTMELLNLLKVFVYRERCKSPGVLRSQTSFWSTASCYNRFVHIPSKYSPRHSDERMPYWHIWKKKDLIGTIYVFKSIKLIDSLVRFDRMMLHVKHLSFASFIRALVLY